MAISGPPRPPTARWNRIELIGTRAHALPPRTALHRPRESKAAPSERVSLDSEVRHDRAANLLD
jgi:hypothetical protein